MVEEQLPTVPPGRFDAFLLVSFGGPEKPEDVMPFLRQVTRGRRIPDARLEAVAEHYYHFGGKSPINDQNRALLAAIKTSFAQKGISVPLLWGNRNWKPFISDAVAELASLGVKRVGAFVTSAFGSYSGCRQYREDIEKACGEVGANAPEIVKLPQFYNHRGFLLPQIASLQAAGAAASGTLTLFTAHSIPESMAASGPYTNQLRGAAAYVAEALGLTRWQLAFQSRSGPPTQPWLGPDVVELVKTINISEIRRVVVAPIGFVSDHMEIVWDLDHELRQVVEARKLAYHRIPTVGTNRDFVAMITDLFLAPDFEENSEARLFTPPQRHCFPGCCVIA